MSSPAVPKSIRIFFSYAINESKDKKLLDKLKDHLSIWEWRGLIGDLSDSATKNNLNSSVENAINQADIHVLLIGSGFFASKFCVTEMNLAIERCNAKEARLIPVPLHSIELQGTPLESYEPLTVDGKPLYRSLRRDRDGALSEMAKKIGKIVEELAELKVERQRSETRVLLDTIPYRHNRFFTDRQAMLATLHTNFASNQTIQQPYIQALKGLPGMGKTQVAVEYAHTYKHEYQASIWLEAASRDTLSEGILSLAKLFSLSKQDLVDEHHRFDAVKHWLQSHEKWLLILDGLEDFQLIDLLIPVQSRGHVLLTTLSQITGHLAHEVSVERMTTDDSVLFLLRRAKIIRKQMSLDDVSATAITQATSIVRAFDGLSLALDQAGAYIEETGCGLDGYLELLDRDWLKLLAERGEFIPLHQASVMLTFSITFEKVARGNPHALELLYLFAFLDPSVIPVEMIKRGASALGGTLRTLAVDPFVLNKVIRLLLKYSLVQCHTNAAVLSIHRVVQAILKEKLPPKQQRQWAVRVVSMVNSIFPEAEYEEWQACDLYLPQARRCFDLITEFQLRQKEAAYLLLRLGSYCYQRAYYQEAERYLTGALQLWEQVMGSEHLDMAQTLNNLALVYHKRGKYQQAEEYHQHALVIRERAGESDGSEVAETLNNLAVLYRDLGRYQEAESLFQRVLTIDESTIGPDHPDTAASLSNLASVYDELGKHSQADTLYQRALSIEERTLGPDHPDWALSLSNLASRYERLGNYQQAEAFYLKALALQEQVIGSEHPDTAQTLNYLAGLYETLKKYEEAEALYQRALGIYKKALGAEHRETALVLNNLASLYCQQGRYLEAEASYQQALNIYEKALGEKHHYTADALDNLGRLYHLMKKDELAEPLLRRGLLIREQVLGREHFNTGLSLKALGELLIHQHRNEEDELLFQRYLDIIQQERSPEHPDIALAQEQYASPLERISAQE